MKSNLGVITEKLKNNKIRLSHQRLKVLDTWMRTNSSYSGADL